MTPAEPSRPGRKWSGGSASTWAQDPFWSVVVILFFVLGLYMTASGALAISRLSADSDLLIPTSMCLAGVAIVSGLLFVYSSHPRTRSGSASASIAAMKILMALAGIVLFIGGAVQVINTSEFVEQLALALVSLFFIVVPISLHMTSR